MGRGIDDVVSDQMRQVAGDCQHHVVVLGGHQIDLGPAGFPKCLELRNGRGICALDRREQAPAAVEQAGEAGLRAGLFGAGDRVAGDKVDTFWHMRPAIADDAGFDGADVGQDAARLQRSSDFSGERTARADRCAEDDEIGIANGACGCGVGFGNQAEFECLGARFRRAGVADDGASEATAAHGVTKGRSDQSDADQGDTIEQRLR